MTSTHRTIRTGARGGRKVRSGCPTCKIRHKKCDEMRPACTPCVSTGRACDFLSEKPTASSNGTLDGSTALAISLPKLDNLVTDLEASNFAYFQVVSAKEFNLYFDDTSWETTVIQVAYTEPCIFHATVAIGALSRRQYHTQRPQQPDPFAFSMKQYNLAIQAFSSRLDDSIQSCELAILGSIVFIALEVLMGRDNRVSVHMRSALALLQNSSDTRATATLGYLARALNTIETQFSSFASLERPV